MSRQGVLSKETHNREVASEEKGPNFIELNKKQIQKTQTEFLTSESSKQRQASAQHRKQVLLEQKIVRKDLIQKKWEIVRYKRTQLMED